MARAAENDEDVAEEEDLEAQEGNLKEPAEEVAGAPLATEEDKETLKEDPNWQWMPLYGPTAPWTRVGTDKENMAKFNPLWMPQPTPI